MNTHELRTRTKKAEIQPDIVVRKAEKNLRQTENSQFELRIFGIYQPLTPISQQKLNFLLAASDTTIVDCTSAGIAQSRPDAAGSTPVRLLFFRVQIRFTTFHMTHRSVQAFGSA